MIRLAASRLAIAMAVLFALNEVALAQSNLDRLIADKKACTAALEVNERESEARKAQLRRIADDDYAALCRYGRTVGQPGLERGVARIRNTPGCRSTDDFYMKAVVEAQIRLAAGNRRAVASDCKKARM